jgi:hypothetical protein
MRCVQIQVVNPRIRSRILVDQSKILIEVSKGLIEQSRTITLANLQKEEMLAKLSTEVTRQTIDRRNHQSQLIF